MYWSEISIRFSRGRSTPAIRAILDVLLVLCARRGALALALLVARVGGADDPHDALALDDLALVTDLLDRSADLHDATASREKISLFQTKSPAAASGGTGAGMPRSAVVAWFSPCPPPHRAVCEGRPITQAFSSCNLSSRPTCPEGGARAPPA